MAREIVQSIWCDFCLAEDDTKANAEELPPITIGNQKPRLLALCKGHRTGWYDPMVEAILEHGMVVDPTAKSPAKAALPTEGGVQCPQCKGMYKNRNSLMAHLRTQHQMTLREATQGEPLAGFDLPVREQTPKVKRTECELCGKVYEWPHSVRPVQALAVHKAKHHGIAGQSRDAKRRREQRDKS